MACREVLRSIKVRLLATGSIFGIMAAGPAFADLSDDFSGYWVSAGSAYLTTDGASQPLLKAGLGLPAQSGRVRDEWEGQVSVGGPLDALLPGWDFRFGYTGIRSPSHHQSAEGTAGATLTLPNGGTAQISEPPTFNGSIKQGFDIGDFDIGQDVGLGDLRTRIFFGARVVSFNQSSRSSLLGGEGAVELSCSHYIGGGPRIGASSTYPLITFGDVTVSLAGNLDGSMLAGESYHKAEVTSLGTLSPVTLPEAESDTPQTVLNTSASLGVTMDMAIDSHDYSLTAGYMGQGWWGIVDTRVQNYTLAGTAGTEAGNQYQHGPFLSASFKW